MDAPVTARPLVVELKPGGGFLRRDYLDEPRVQAGVVAAPGR